MGSIAYDVLLLLEPMTSSSQPIEKRARIADVLVADAVLISLL